MAQGTTSTTGRTSRRRLLRLTGGALALGALAVGATGCRNDAQDTTGGGTGSGGTGKDKGKGTDSGTGGKGSGGTDAAGAPKPLWTKSVSAETYGNNDELVAVAGVVIASGAPLDALDGKTGRPRWTLKNGATPGAPLLIGDDTLYLASSAYDGTVSGHDPATGKETWRGRLGKEYRQPRPVAVDDKQVYVIAEILEADGSSHTNVIAALDSGTGRVVWKEQRDLGTEQTGVHTAVRDRFLVYTDLKKNLTVRDTATGRQVWTHKTTSTNYGVFALHGDLVIVPQGRVLQAFALADGAEKWSLKTDEFATFKEPTVLGDTLYIADSNRTLRSVDPRTGKENWRSEDLSKKGAQPPRQFLEAGGTLYGATDLDEGGGIHAFDPKTGTLRWTFNDKSGDFHAWLMATDGTHVFALHGTKLHALPA